VVVDRVWNAGIPRQRDRMSLMQPKIGTWERTSCCGLAARVAASWVADSQWRKVAVSRNAECGAEGGVRRGVAVSRNETRESGSYIFFLGPLMGFYDLC
jgi:hypothetical protein